MKGFLTVTAALAVFGLAFWAYRENYATQELLSEAQDLQRDISQSRARLNMLKVEWAYLNRPDRLMELAELNFDRLQLFPFRPDQFGRIDEVTYPRAVPQTGDGGAPLPGAAAAPDGTTGSSGTGTFRPGLSSGPAIRIRDDGAERAQPRPMLLPIAARAGERP